MKTLCTAILLILSIGLISFGYKTKTIVEINNQKQFQIKQLAEARMIAIEEGKLATTKGTTVEIRNYGAQITKNERYILEQLKHLADIENVKLPNKISKEKQKKLSILKKNNAESFDEKFLNTITNESEKDIEKFKKVRTIKDTDVSQFAVKNLPILERHLCYAQTIKDNYKK